MATVRDWSACREVVLTELAVFDCSWEAGKRTFRRMEMECLCVEICIGRYGADMADWQGKGMNHYYWGKGNKYAGLGNMLFLLSTF